jgi:predicted nuclease of predicted toxin-antitoxin system
LICQGRIRHPTRFCGDWRRIDQRVLVTKDADFVDSFLLHGRPPKLLFIATGNIPNDDLLALFEKNLPVLIDALTSQHFVEFDATGLTIHV